MSAESIVDSAFREVARQTVRGAIEEHIGYGIDTEVKTAIKNLAEEMTRTDPEIRKMIRDRLIYWIGKQ